MEIAHERRRFGYRRIHDLLRPQFSPLYCPWPRDPNFTVGSRYDTRTSLRLCPRGHRGCREGDEKRQRWGLSGSKPRCAERDKPCLCRTNAGASDAGWQSPPGRAITARPSRSHSRRAHGARRFCLPVDRRFSRTFAQAGVCQALTRGEMN